jgi:ubiquitin-conjugating enzyme E2 J2
MVERQAIGRLNRELKLLIDADTPYFVARPSDSDMLIWHYVIFDLPENSPYFGGQYHGKLIFPRDYPLRPPSIMMCTVSGRFEINKRLCLSISDYHPETWNPSWRVETILLGLVSFMLDESDPVTAGGIISSFSQRREHAILSFFRNSKNNEFRSLFPEFTDPERYFIDHGFLKAGKRSENCVALSSTGLSPQDLDNVHSVDGLRDLLARAGCSTKADQSRKSMSRNLAPLIAVAILFALWSIYRDT